MKRMLENMKHFIGRNELTSTPQKAGLVAAGTLDCEPASLNVSLTLL